MLLKWFCVNSINYYGKVIPCEVACSVWIALLYIQEYKSACITCMLLWFDLTGAQVQSECLQCTTQALSCIDILCWRWFGLRKEFSLCPSRKTSLSNAVYNNSREFSDDVIDGNLLLHALEIWHSWVIRSVMNWTAWTCMCCMVSWNSRLPRGKGRGPACKSTVTCHCIKILSEASVLA